MSDGLLTRLADRARRQRTLRELGESGHTDALTHALRYVEDAEYATRVAALECIKLVHDPRAASAVVGRLRDDEALVRVAAIEALVAINDIGQSGANDLTSLLRDSNETVRAYSAWALGRLRVREAITSIRASLNGEQSAVARAGMLEALYRLSGHAPYLDLLLDHLRATDPEARAFASNSLVGVASKATATRLISELRAAASNEPLPAIRDVLTRDLEELEEMNADGDFDLE